MALGQSLVALSSYTTNLISSNTTTNANSTLVFSFVVWNDPSMLPLTFGDSAGNSWTPVANTPFNDGNSGFQGNLYIYICSRNKGSAAHNFYVAVGNNAQLGLTVTEVTGRNVSVRASGNTSSGYQNTNFVGPTISAQTGSDLIAIAGSLVGPSNVETWGVTGNGFSIVASGTSSTPSGGNWMATAFAANVANVNYTPTFTLTNTNPVWVSTAVVELPLFINTYVHQTKIYANGAMSANAFVQAALPTGVALRVYGNNVVHSASLVQNGAGIFKIYANGQLSVNNTIITPLP